MLTCPSDSLPQIVCPMDEDSIPPNPFCSAPSHSEPPPPLLPLFSVTPSCPSDGIPGQRRSGRIQGITEQTPKKQSSTDSGSAPKPFRHNPPPTKRQREGESMGQVSRRKQLRVEGTHEDGFDGRCPTEHKNNQMDQGSPQKKTVSTENVVEQLAYSTTQNHTDIAKSDMDGDLDTLESDSAPKGWVIGPLFQSFRSKMASFTEIVMSPVKLFRPNSPPPFMDNPEKLAFEQPAHGPSDVVHAEPNNMFHPDGQSGTEVEAAQQRLSDAQNTKTGVKYSKKLFFDEELSTNDFKKADEHLNTCEDINWHDSAPVQQNHIPYVPTDTISESSDPAIGSSVLLHTSVNFITSNQSKLEISSVTKDQKERQTALIEPLPRKRTRNKSELKKDVSKTLMCQFKKEESGLEANNSNDNQKALPLSFSGCHTQSETDSLQLTGNKKEIQMERRHLIRQSLRSNSSNGRTMKTATNLQQMEYSVAGLGRASRGLKPLYQSQDMLKRKETMMMMGNDTSPTKKGEFMNEASDSGLLIEPPREEAMLTGTVVHKEVIRNPSIKKKAHSTRANKKVNEVSVTVNEGMLKKKTESSTEAMLIYSMNKSGNFSGHDQNLCRSNVKPSASCKRQKTRAGPVTSVVSIDESMDLETTVAISSTKVKGGLLSEVFIHPEIKQHQGKCRNATKKPQKRKSPVQASSVTESDIALVSSSSVLLVESSEPMATDFNISQPPQREEKLKTEFTRLSKRPKKGSSDVFKSSESRGAQERQHYMDNNNVATRMSSHSSCPVLLNNEAKPVIYEKERSPASPQDEVFSTVISVSMPRSSARKVNTRPKRADKQKRRVLHSRTYKGEEVPKSVTMDDAELATAPAQHSGSSTSRGLLRSYSCPEIPSFRSHETPWTGSQHLPHHSRTPTSPQHQSSNAQHVHNSHKSVHRARRHTVCSVEVEREIAPLCLRKEVYPTRRSAPYDFVTQHLSPTLALSPSTTLSALASCFLSSPLAFLSKKGDMRCSAASPSTSMHVSPSTSSSSKSLFSSSTWHLPSFLHSADSSHATLDPSSSTSLLECEPQIGQQCEGEDDGEDTSSSGQEYEDVGLREEKALSDSEIKVVQKHEERGKVSSIRIRKTLPKPQNNLTPMGLPKPIRVKKKEFSLEEIYTNKNFSKPPESRLETIFEVPFNRRNGSESWFGQRRVKRFLEFLDVGEVRKPKKPLVGIGKTGLLASRTRRGGSTKDEPSLTAQDVDSLLCAKLDELNLWLISDQNS